MKCMYGSSHIEVDIIIEININFTSTKVKIFVLKHSYARRVEEINSVAVGVYQL